MRARRGGSCGGGRDKNQQELVAAFKKLGCSVFDTSQVGYGFPDLIVGCAGLAHLVEVKNPENHYGRSGLSASQQAFARDWRGGKLFVVSSVDEVAALVRNLRAMVA